MFNGAVTFRKVIECVTYDTTDYYLQYGKCKYLSEKNGTHIRHSIDYLAAHYSSALIAASAKKPMPKRSDWAHSLTDDEEEVMSESDDKEESERYFEQSKLMSKSKPKDNRDEVHKAMDEIRAIKLANDKKPGPDDFDGDTNMMY
jgi:hypothetical protein